MALRGIKPKCVEKRIKCFLYGPAKIGKTTAAIQFPNPYWIDTEGCADKKKYSNLIDKSDGLVFQTQDFDELIKEVKTLMSIKHQYKTLIIDSMSILYNDLVNKYSMTKDGKDNTGFGKNYLEANKKVKHLINLLLRLDMNVIITSHSKTEYGNNMTVIGQTFDCYKKLDYLFDLIIEIQERGKDRIGLVKGSRYDEFVKGDSFIFSYDEISKRYNREIMEKESSFESLATIEQVSELKRLVELLKIDEEIISKWLDKSNSNHIDEMNTETIQKCIDHLNSKIKGN